MNTEFWLDRWEQNQIGFHQQTTNSHLVRHWQRLNVTPNSRVFVPLCGKTHDLLWLRAQGYSVLGVEISPLAARDFFRENQLSAHTTQHHHFSVWSVEGLTLLQGDFFNLNSDHTQNVEGVFDRAALVALPAELRRQYAQHLKNILPENAKILLVTLEYAQELMAGPPFSVSESDVYALYEDQYEISVLAEQDVINEHPQFQAKGISSILEKVYCLIPRKQ